MILSKLAKYHPVVIEGMGYYDPRDPSVVADQIVTQLTKHWQRQDKCNNNHNKPKLLITQGDPLTERGISAITPLVSERLGIPRGLVVLDDCIDPNHSLSAPRDNVVLEVKYSQLFHCLDLLPLPLPLNGDSNDRGVEEANHRTSTSSSSIATHLTQRVERSIATKNQQRQKVEKPPLKSYFKDYAMLQEVTKAACQVVCGDITVAHTAQDISDFSVTSFYQVGLDLGLLDFDAHYVPYTNNNSTEDYLDFDTIDTR